MYNLDMYQKWSHPTCSGMLGGLDDVHIRVLPGGPYLPLQGNAVVELFSCVPVHKRRASPLHKR